jgi:glycosyltransferase involved in cell wall biosynthesis
MRVFLISRRIPHHAEHSGYDLLARHVHGTRMQDDALFRMASKIGYRRLSRFKALSTPWYSVDALRREIAVCGRAALLPCNAIYHWLYAENDLRLSPSWRWRWNNRFVGSFHQPSEYLEQHVVDPSHVRGLDAVVVVSRSQVPFFARHVPEHRIHHVPHGVDVDYWCPDAGVQRHPEPTFLFVGAWLRDVGMAKAAIQRCHAEGLKARFRVVAAPSHVAEFSGLPATTVMTGISDSELLGEYRRAHALFLPLTMATANNSILESMACGTPVLSTCTGGTPEYVGPDCGELVPPKDVDAAVSAIRRACMDRGRVETLGSMARKHVLAFAWPRVGALQMQAYERISKPDRSIRQGLSACQP